MRPGCIRFGSLRSSVLVLISCQTSQVENEMARAQARLLETSMKADSAGMVQARQRFEHLLEDQSLIRHDSLSARAHYFIAFANWQLAFVTFNNREGAKKIIAEALQHLTSATGLDENLIEAYGVARRCQYWRFMLDPGAGKAAWTESQSALEQARALAPQHPVVVLEEAIDLFYKPPQIGGSQSQGLERFHAALASMEAWRPGDMAYQKWWHATAHMFFGQACLGAAQPEEADKAFHAALALEPDFEYVKRAMLPMTQTFTPPQVRDFAGVVWTVLATDKETDGRNPNWAEAKALAYFYDTATDTLWFKIDLARQPNPAVIGMNVAADTDQNQNTGANWWGSNRAFKYDKLVTVWVLKAAGNSYRGAAGLADANGAQIGRFTNLFQNNLAFHVDAEKKFMLLGFKSKQLDEDGNFNLIAAVGSNAGWNDDIPQSKAEANRLHAP